MQTIDFLSQMLKNLWGIKYLAHLAHMAISLFPYMTAKLLKGAGVEVVEWHISDSHSYDVSSTSKYKTIC